VITWKDFILDDVVGPVMMDPSPIDSNETEVCRRTRLGSTIVMEDEESENSSIQETRQEQRPARMVGHSSLDSSASPHMEVSSSNRALTGLWPRGET
jgi:hypothetical protein